MEPAAPAPRQTLETVAKAAGVSRQTVSNALNAPDLLAAETRDRVLAAVEELGYRPSRAARQLRTRRSHTLGLEVEPPGDGISSWLLDHFLHALVERGEAEGYQVLLFSGSRGDLGRYADLLAGADLDGMVLTATHHGDPRPGWLLEHRVPFAVFGRPWGTEELGADGSPVGSHAWVDVDSRLGIRDAVHHLREQGHERIAFLGWPAGSGVGDDRRAAWAASLDDAIPGSADAARRRGHDLAVLDGVEAGRTAIGPLLDRPEAPTAVVCASDSLALGATLAGSARQLPVAHVGDGAGHPGLAVVGYDDTPVAAAVGLSSVAQPIADAARACIELVLSQLPPGTPPTAPPAPRLLPPRLVVRASSRRPPSGTDLPAR